MVLSCSWDPDQDLQSWSKLLTWYDLSCIISVGGDGGGLCPSIKIRRGGGGGGGGGGGLGGGFRGGLSPCCKIHRGGGGGDYVLVVKFMGGLCPCIQK